MRRIEMMSRFSGILAVAALVAAMASTASASELCAGVTNVTMVGAGGCTVAGDPGVVFSNFVVTVVGASSATIGISAASFADDQIDLQFQIALGTETIPDTADIVLSYTVTGGIDGVDDAFQASPLGPGGSVAISEVACGVAFTSACPEGNFLSGYAGTSTGQLVSDSASFTQGVVSPVYINKDIAISDAAMSEFTNSQSIAPAGVPETATFSMLGAGLLGLGLLKRRARR